MTLGQKSDQIAEAPFDTGHRAGFTRATQRMLTALRMLAYSLATLFMIVMVVRGVLLTRDEMEAGGDRSIRSAAAAMMAMVEGGSIDQARAQAVLGPLAPLGVSLRIEASPVAVNTEAATVEPASEVRRIRLGSGPWTLVATTDHAAIWKGALRANMPFIMLVLALGLPVIMIFLYMGWAVNRPALQLLAFAQAGADEVGQPPKLPMIWNSVLARLKQLRDSQTQMQAFLDHAPIGMMFRDSDGKLVMINRYGASFYDQSPEDLAAKPMSFFNAHFPQSDALAKPLFLDPLMKAEITSVETEFHGPSGEKMNLLVKSFPVLDGAGSVSLIGNYFIDVTDQRQAEKALKETKALFEAFIHNAPNPMVLMKPNGQYVMINDAAAAYYEKSSEELVVAGSKVVNASFPDARNVIMPMMGRVIETLKAESVDTPFVSVNGDIREVAFSLFPILGVDGGIAFVGNISHDLTDERRAQADLAKSNEALHQSEKLAALGQLLAGVAHELNNPLAIVLGRAAILKDKLAGTPHVASIQKLRDAADRCARIVKTFLAMARQTGPRRSAVQINDLVAGALDMTAYGLRTSDIKLVQELAPDVPTIEADEDQIVQLLINLIINAQHALQERETGRQMIVRTGVDKTQRNVIIEIVDNGPGVSADVAARIFDPFYTTKAVGEGTGLGLSVCKGMVEAHGGTLAMHTTRGGGATFRATLPLLASIATAPMRSGTAPQVARGRVLIVDDEPEIAAILADCLAPLGLECDIASDGHSALQRIAATHFDAIFCDVRMPGMDGIALHTRLKAGHPALAARLAFVSGDVLHHDIARLKSAAECPIIEKPFDPQIVRAVAMLLLAPAGEKP